MKKTLILLITLIPYFTSAQDSIAKNAFDIKTIYAGALMGGRCDADTFKVSKWASYRVGGWVTGDFTSNLSIQAWGIFHQEVGTDSYALTAMWLDYKPGKRFKISAGNLPTPVAELRPHPVSGDGQFETYTHALLPGVASGAKFAFATGDFEAKGGVFLQNGGNKLLSAKIKQGNVAIAGYVGDSTFYGGGVTIDSKYFYTIMSLTDRNIGNFTSIKTPLLNHKVDLLSDMGIDGKGHFVRGEWGALWNFSVGTWSGLIAVSYQHEKGAFNTYLFIHL